MSPLLDHTTAAARSAEFRRRRQELRQPGALTREHITDPPEWLARIRLEALLALLPTVGPARHRRILWRMGRLSRRWPHGYPGNTRLADVPRQTRLVLVGVLVDEGLL